jgi:tRNA-splicing ligase RtcB (3'-phosphate/5'-hydroxy nucleic acid ligase)
MCRIDALAPRIDELRIMARVGKFDHKRMWRQLGTLGGGNHFIELCLDESQVAAINCHHNYANLEDHFGEQIWVPRKGAISAHGQTPTYAVRPG